MKLLHIPTIIVVVLGALLGVPARAQLGVGGATELTQLMNNAELVATVLKLRDQIRRMDENLAGMGALFRNDRFDYFRQLNELAARGPLSYASPGVYDFYREAIPAYLAFTPEVLEIINAEGLTQIWQSAAVDTFAATLASAAEQGAAELRAEDDRAELERRLGLAGGNMSALEVLGEIQLHTGQEVSRLNQLLASILSNQSAFFGHQVTNLGTLEATERFLLYEALESLSEPSTLATYDDAVGFTGIPVGLN